ncbi:hypothetical protein CI102_9480 [Trichoderma harzianum]|nr:hypothetical protein CI102_9480 [Trichoderma harzianum]
MSAKYILGALSLLLTNIHAAPTANKPAPSTISYCPPTAATFETQQKIFADVWNTFVQNDIGISVEMGVMENGTTAAFVDFWRFQGTCIVEHWDVIEFVTGDSPNPSPLFPLPPPLKPSADAGKSQ